MARTASPLTVAIRALCDKTKFNITYSEARPLLTEQGFEMAREPNKDMDADVAALEAKFEKAEKKARREYDFDEKNEADVQAIRVIAAKEVGKTLGWDDRKSAAVLDEMDCREAFKNERNSFDVAKHYYKKTKDSAAPTPSRKPEPTPTHKGAAAKTGGKFAPVPAVVKGPRPKHRSAASALPNTDEMAALAFIHENGGIAAVKKLIASAKADANEARKQAEEKDAEAASMEAMLEAADKIRKMLEAA